MKKIVLLTSITIFSWAGWMLGDRFGVMTAYMISFAGSLVGVYLGVKVNRNYLE
jgi:putative Mn2+ efflux pump MntP